MPRCFIEVSYKGTGYAGFQVQQNANTIQAELEKALNIYFRVPVNLTGASRTDTGVHARQNFFHFDTVTPIGQAALVKAAYHLNAILPGDIMVRSIFPVHDTAHCRFDAVSRSYQYTIIQHKDPFLQDRAYYYPYTLDIQKLQQAADLLRTYTGFGAFAKKNNQAHTDQCHIIESVWQQQPDRLVYDVTANRFLRGMVRGLVGTMLRVGRGIHSIQQLQAIIESKDPAMADFSTPPQGLTLLSVHYNKPLQ